MSDGADFGRLWPRRALLGLPLCTGGALLTAASGSAAATSTPSRRRLHHRPPRLLDPIRLDLSLFDSRGLLPGWNGKEPEQGSNGMYPHDRDLLILGHGRRPWSGGGFIRGGRNVVWLGGAYHHGLWLRNFVGDACAEGVLISMASHGPGTETGDGVTLVPDVTTNGRSRVSILNCRVEGVDGNHDGLHGDIFQLPASYDAPAGYCSTPGRVTIERLTGSTGYQGLYLANQHFGSGRVNCRRLTLRDVNLRQTRGISSESVGVASSYGINLLWMVDMSSDKAGDVPYPKNFHNVYLDPLGDEDLNSMIFPQQDKGGTNPSTGTKLLPSFSADGRTAWYPAEMQLDGVIRLGPPPGGDFARRAGRRGRGGLDVPGIGYRSPGYRRR